jgi:hypothetical protein
MYLSLWFFSPDTSGNLNSYWSMRRYTRSKRRGHSRAVPPQSYYSGKCCTHFHYISCCPILLIDPFFGSLFLTLCDNYGFRGIHWIHSKTGILLEISLSHSKVKSIVMFIFSSVSGAWSTFWALTHRLQFTNLHASKKYCGSWPDSQLFLLQWNKASNSKF